MTKDLYLAWRAGKVNRMHTMPQLVRENIAEHTWGLLFLILRVWPEAPRDFIVAAIFHDAGEIATGDMPGNVKWALPPEQRRMLEDMEAKEVATMGVPVIVLSEEQCRLLEIFDRVEFCVSCLHEMRLGNVNAAEYFERSAAKARKIAEELAVSPYKDVADKLFLEMRDTCVKNLARLNGAPYHVFS